MLYFQNFSNHLLKEYQTLVNSDNFNIKNFKNVKFALRNYKLQKAIVDAENEKFKTVRELLKMCEIPYGKGV